MVVRPRLLVALALLAACGDSGGATAGADATSQASSTGAEPTPTTTHAATTTGATDGATATGATTTNPDPSTSTDPTTTTGDSGDSGTTSTSSPPDTTDTPDTATSEDSTTGTPVDPQGCVTSVDGWCWTHPLPHGNRLHDIWDDGQGRVWIVGGGGTRMYNDGQGWVTLPADRVDALRGIWGAAPDDIWAVGDYGAIRHWDGVAWTDQASPTTKFLRGVWGSGADDVWAVGNQGTVLHHDGVAWTVVDTGLGQPEHLTVWGSGADDVWIGSVGFGGPVYHWNGAVWTYRSVDDPGSVTGLWGRGPADVYATRDQGTVLNHWTGSLPWIELDAPFGKALTTVVGDDGDRLWVGGPQIMLEYTGDTYTENQDFWWVDVQRVARVGDATLAVGSRGAVARHQADTWTFEHGDFLSPKRPFGSIGGNGPDDIWASGYATAHWDGDAWTFIDIGQGVKDLVEIAGAGGTLWAIATNNDAWLWRCVDGVWAEQMKLGLWYPHALWAQDATTVWMVGDIGSDDVARWDGQNMTTWKFASVSDLHGLAPDDIWAVGSSERLWHFDGQIWTQVHLTPMGESLRHVHAVGPDDVWAASGLEGNLFHWDGVDWTKHINPTKWGVTDLWASGPDDVWAVGGEQASPGIILHWDGLTLSEQISGASEGLYALWGTGDDVWTVGGEHSALVLRR